MVLHHRGLQGSQQNNPTIADKAFSLLSTKSGLALQPIKATKASPNAVVDEHLTWEQITTVRHTLIATANRVSWAHKLTMVLTVRPDVTTLVTGSTGQRVTQTRNCAATSDQREGTKLWFNAKEEKTGDK